MLGDGKVGQLACARMYVGGLETGPWALLVHLWQRDPLGAAVGLQLPAIRQFDIADRHCEFWIAQFWVAQGLQLRIHLNLLHVVTVFGVPFLP